jgi:hypothetical protein
VAEAVATIADDVARTLCYTATTGSINSSFVWGMANKLRKGLPGSGSSADASVRDQVEWVSGAHRDALAVRAASASASASVSHYREDDVDDVDDVAAPSCYVAAAPTLALSPRVMIDVDFLDQGDFAGYHRCGWAYAVAGLRYLSPAVHGRTVDPQSVVRFDSFVDRTFHWGCRTLAAVGKLPYRDRWAGIVHHAFDTTHSHFNCEQLLDNPYFQQSLPFCVTLIALSDDLRDKLRAGLAARGLPAVPVFAVPHPTEVIVDPSRRFTVDKFLENPERSVVQIGAWLRDPYGIYDLRLKRDAPPLAKAVLRGRDMGMYFAPSPPRLPLLRPVGDHTMAEDKDGPFLCCVEDSIDDMIQSWRDADGDGGVCRPLGRYRPRGGGPCRPGNDCGNGGGNGCGCRPGDDCGIDLCMRNKFVTGMLEALRDRQRAVRNIDRLDDDEYDGLLAHNVVFLKLIDCSAVNTALECVARGTPLIVNRLPALEELLGEDYPGFYETADEADALISSWGAILAAHLHLVNRVDTAKLTLCNFVKGVEEALYQAVGRLTGPPEADPCLSLI